MYCDETAAEAVVRKLERLRNEPILRKITMNADRIGFEKVAQAMCRINGPMHRQYLKTGGYLVPIDDLRRCVYEFRAKMKFDDAFTKSLKYN